MGIQDLTVCVYKDTRRGSSFDSVYLFIQAW